MAGNGDHLEQSYRHCLETLRDRDRDRYLACLLMPRDKRGAIASLYLFNAEIARIRDVVREPMAGEVRLQWWREVIDDDARRSPAGNPAAEALIATIEDHALPRATFQACLDARIFDLYDDPMPDRLALEGYAGETASALLQLSALVLDAAAAPSAATAAGHAGVAQTLAGLLLLMPRHAARGQVYVPGDILTACGLGRAGFLSGDDPDGLRRVDAALVALGREHLEKARLAAADLDDSVFPAFLPVALVEQVLTAAERTADRNPRTQMPEIAQWRRQIRLFSAALRRKF